MNLQNGYKVILEKAPTVAEDGVVTRNFAASKEAGGADAVEVVINNKPEGIKLIYSDGKNLFASTTGIPAETDAIITLTADGEVVFGETEEAPAEDVPAEEATDVE